MVQILSAVERSPTFMQKLSGGVGRGLERADTMVKEHQQKQALKAAGIDESFMNLPPEIMKAYASEKFASDFANTDIADFPSKLGRDSAVR